MLTSLFDMKKKAKPVDIERALQLRERVYTDYSDLKDMEEEQFLFFAYYSKMIADAVIKLSSDDQKTFISHCATHLM